MSSFDLDGLTSAQGDQIIQLLSRIAEALEVSARHGIGYDRVVVDESKRIFGDRP